MVVDVEDIVVMQASGQKSRPPRWCGQRAERIQWNYVCSVCYSVVREMCLHGPCVIMLERFSERHLHLIEPGRRTSKRRSRISDLCTSACRCVAGTGPVGRESNNSRWRLGRPPCYQHWGKDSNCREGKTLTFRCQPARLGGLLGWNRPDDDSQADRSE